ncbi:MAG: hypothetical protein QXT31_03950 [Candidatus Bathyarchaeia archaeon]
MDKKKKILLLTIIIVTLFFLSPKFKIDSPPLLAHFLHESLIEEASAQPDNWILEKRGMDYELYYNPALGRYRYVNAPEWVWNGSAYTPYIAYYDPIKNCYVLRNGRITAEIYSYYARYYDVNYTEVRLYMEQWEILYLQNLKWKSAIMPSPSLNPTSQLLITNSSGAFLTLTYENWAGKLNITYALREALALKHYISFKTSFSGKFMAIQHWSGIMADEVNDEAITTLTNINSTSFIFKKGGKITIIEDQSSMVYEEGGLGELVLKQQRFLLPQPIDIQANGLKADYAFGYWNLNIGETLTIDPATYTFQPPTADTYINSYPDYVNYNYGGATYLEVYGYQPISPPPYVHRALLKFDMSSVIPSGSTINSATLSLYIYATGGDVVDKTVFCYRITSTDWVEGTATGAIQSGSVCWNYRQYNTLAWSSAGGDYTTTDGASATCPSAGNWISWTVTAQVQYAVNYVGRVAHFLIRLSTENPGNGRWFQAYSKESTNSNKPKLYVDYTPPNNPPTNVSLTLDLTGAAYKGTKTLLAGKQEYKFVYKVSDPQGVNDISYAEIRLDPAGKNVILRATRTGSDTWSFSEQSDPNNYVTLGTCSHSTSGNEKTFNFMVKINWNWDDSPETITVQAYVIDSYSASDQDDYTNVFGVENDLTFSNLSVSDTRVNPSQTLTFSGYLYYEGTSIYPPDGNYQVKVLLSGNQKGSTDTTLVSGQFSINDVIAESTVGSYTYSVTATYAVSANFPNVIVDRIEFYEWGTEDSDKLVNVGDSVKVWIKARYDYDDSAFSNGSLVINGTTASYDSINGYWYAYFTENQIVNKTFVISSFTDGAYGLTTSIMNANPIHITWTKINLYNTTVYGGTENPIINLTTSWGHNSSFVNQGRFYVYDGNKCVGEALSNFNGLIQFTLNSTLHDSGSLKINGTKAGIRTNQTQLAYNIAISNLGISAPIDWVVGSSKSVTISYNNNANLAGQGLTLENVKTRFRFYNGSITYYTYEVGPTDIPYGAYRNTYTFPVYNITEKGYYNLEIKIIQLGSEYELASYTQNVFIALGTAGGGGGGTNPSRVFFAINLTALYTDGSVPIDHIAKIFDWHNRLVSEKKLYGGKAFFGGLEVGDYKIEIYNPDNKKVAEKSLSLIDKDINIEIKIPKEIGKEWELPMPTITFGLPTPLLIIISSVMLAFGIVLSFQIHKEIKAWKRERKRRR